MRLNFILTLAFLFFAGSSIGWVLELFFRRFLSRENTEHRWVNPGFLVGPYLPIYGFGLIFLYLLAGLERYSFISVAWLNKLLLFVIMALCMTAIEYIAGKIFIVGMKVKLWDYAGKPGNIQGIICPEFSLYWALLGALYYFIIHPRVLSALGWLSDNLAFSFFIGFFYGVIVIDVCYSTRIVTKVRAAAKEYGVVIKYQELRAHIRTDNEKTREKLRFLLASRSTVSLSESVKRYLEEKRARLETNYEKLEENIDRRISKRKTNRKDK